MFYHAGIMFNILDHNGRRVDVDCSEVPCQGLYTLIDAKCADYNQ